MDKFLIFSFVIVCFCKHGTNSLKLPGPLVYVVTPRPAPRSAPRAAPAPFYYHNWMRRMDSPLNATTTTTPKTKTPDLIFAEFESGAKMKSIRNLLEREKVDPKPTTPVQPVFVPEASSTPRPIYVPEKSDDVSQEVKYVSPMVNKKKMEETKPVDMTDYFALYNNLYNPDSAAQVPEFMPSTTSSSTTSTTSTTTPNPAQNAWHVIDSQKYDQYIGQWEEQPVAGGDLKEVTSESTSEDESKPEVQENDEIDDNFALPGFASNPGNGAENESRAINSGPNMRFPYVNLKPFQIKTLNKPLNSISNSKKGNNLYTSIDQFPEVKNPVRGEAQDVVPMMRQPIDRYNPAQPYLPQYGTKSKQSAPSSPPIKAVANLVPPPPPPPPKISDGNFPAPSNYEPFPPYAMSGSPASSSASPPIKPTSSVSYEVPGIIFDDSDSSYSDSDGPPMDLGYRYKPPPPIFLPTPLPPLIKPSDGYSYSKPSTPNKGGYSYEKPPMMDDSPPDTMNDKPDSTKPSGGYSYAKPSPPNFGGYSYEKPPMMDDSPPDSMDNKPDFGGYHYSKPKTPSPPQDPPASYGHDFDDQDYHHYHHHHTTTTTTTTESPRVNRYSYYYLGKKLYYLPLYFSVYFIVYVGALIIKAVLRHKIVYPNSWRPNDQTASFFSKRSVDSWDLSNENLHEITGKVTHAIAVAGEKYLTKKEK